MAEFIKKHHLLMLFSLILITSGYLVSTIKVNLVNDYKVYKQIDSIYLGLKLDTSLVVSKLEITEILKAQKEQLERNEIKFESLNSRISDFYVSFGILVTLIILYLTFNHFNLKNEVKSNLDENFGTYRNEIEKMHSESLTLINRIKVNSDIAQSKVYEIGDSEPIISPSNLKNDEHGNN
jgi:hypothetical protein